MRIKKPKLTQLTYQRWHQYQPVQQHNRAWSLTHYMKKKLINSHLMINNF